MSLSRSFQGLENLKIKFQVQTSVKYQAQIFQRPFNWEKVWLCEVFSMLKRLFLFP
jgi:uncharacterized protein with von Willebrand factor type A (vWA) domain